MFSGIPAAFAEGTRKIFGRYLQHVIQNSVSERSSKERHVFSGVDGTDFRGCIRQPFFGSLDEKRVLGEDKRIPGKVSVVGFKYLQKGKCV